MSGDEVHMARVDPALGPLGINDGSNYEFYAGETAAGAAIWSKNFSQTVPYFSWWNNSVRNIPFSSQFYLNTIISPRQARDKHRKS
jgi:hypothetical protein